MTGRPCIGMSRLLSAPTGFSRACKHLGSSGAPGDRDRAPTGGHLLGRRVPRPGATPARRGSAIGCARRGPGRAMGRAMRRAMGRAVPEARCRPVGRAVPEALS